MKLILSMVLFKTIRSDSGKMIKLFSKSFYQLMTLTVTNTLVIWGTMNQMSTLSMDQNQANMHSTTG